MLFITVLHSLNEKATQPCYRISYRISLAGEAQMIAQRLITPYTLDITECLTNKSAKETMALTVSKNTVTFWVKELVANIKTESTNQMWNCTFVLQIDRHGRTCSFAGILLVSASANHQRRFCNRGAEVFKVLTILWILECVFTDSTNAMMGEVDGPFAQIKGMAPNCTNSHCVSCYHTLINKSQFT